MTPLLTAIDSNNEEQVKTILSDDSFDFSDLEKPNTLGETPLLFAARRGYSSVVQMLLDQNANVHCLDPENNTVLHLACWHSNYEETLRALYPACCMDFNDNCAHLWLQKNFDDLNAFELMLRKCPNQQVLTQIFLSIESVEVLDHYLDDARYAVFRAKTPDVENIYQSIAEAIKEKIDCIKEKNDLLVSVHPLSGVPAPNCGLKSPHKI